MCVIFPLSLKRFLVNQGVIHLASTIFVTIAPVPFVLLQSEVKTDTLTQQLYVRGNFYFAGLFTRSLNKEYVIVFMLIFILSNSPDPKMTTLPVRCQENQVIAEIIITFFQSEAMEEICADFKNELTVFQFFGFKKGSRARRCSLYLMTLEIINRSDLTKHFSLYRVSTTVFHYVSSLIP